MKQENKHNKFVDFRKQFPFFTYQSYSFQIKNQSLEAEFVFNLSDKYIFKPSIRVPEKAFYQFDKVDKQAIEMFVFHMGMVELISYWKAACSPVVIIKLIRWV